MKVAKVLALSLFMLTFFSGKSQDSQCVSYVKFDYSIIENSNGLSTGEIRFKNLNLNQKLVWHLIPTSTDNLFEKNNLGEGTLSGIPAGEYYMVVRDVSRKGICPVSKLVIIKR